MVSKDSRFDTIQALRFVAAMMVVLFHVAGQYGALGGQLALDLVTHLGFAGVDVFFVISGFVIWRSSRKLGRSDAWFFGFRRAARIFTAYWPAAAFMAVVILAGRGPAGLDHVAWLASITLYPTLIPDLILVVSWTLTFELYFYLLFMLAIRFDARPVVLSLLALSTLGGSLAAAFEIWPQDRLLRLMTSPLLLEFLFGCAIGALLERRRATHGAFWLSAGLAAFVAIGFVYTRLDYMAGFASGPLVRASTYGVASVLIVWGLLALEERVRVPRAVSLLGEASYALYLLHYQVLLLVWHVLPNGFGVTVFRRNLEWGAVAIVAASLVLAVCYYRLVERPLLKAAVAQWRPRTSRKGVPI